MRGFLLCLAALALVCLFTPAAQAGPIRDHFQPAAGCPGGKCQVQVAVDVVAKPVKTAVKVVEKAKVKIVEKAKTEESVRFGRARAVFGKLIHRRAK